MIARWNPYFIVDFRTVGAGQVSPGQARLASAALGFRISGWHAEGVRHKLAITLRVRIPRRSPNRTPSACHLFFMFPRAAFAKRTGPGLTGNALSVRNQSFERASDLDWDRRIDGLKGRDFSYNRRGYGSRGGESAGPHQPRVVGFGR